MKRDKKSTQNNLLADETNLCPGGHGRGGQLSICLVYPNRYSTGMGSLGFQTVYALLASSTDILRERAFLPERSELEQLSRTGQQLLSLENKRPLADFDIIAFSTSFEPDYLHIPQILNLSRIPVRSRNRGESDPLIIAGGAAFFINPEPVAEFIDLICIGEAEQILPGVIEALLSPQSGGRPGLLRLLSAQTGIYVPIFHLPVYIDGQLSGFETSPGIPTEIIRACPPLEQLKPSQTVILTENMEFGDMFLIEVSRGCPRGCRFCTSGFIYRPFRQHPYESIVKAVDAGLAYRNKIGLVGAAVSDYRDIGKLCKYIVDKGAKVSVSSLRIDRLDPEMVDALVACGHKTISLAPEGGSQRMRDLIRKNLTEQQILDACEMLISRDILNLKLYFIIGLPTETEEDLKEMIRLVKAIRERVMEMARLNKRLGEITLSVNPFIPKPFTPLQWCGMEPLPSLEKKVKFLENSLRSIANVNLKVESLKGCYLQALLSRGDRRCSDLLEEMAQGNNLKKAARNCGVDTDALVYRTIPLDAVLPWDILTTIEKGPLRIEYERALL